MKLRYFLTLLLLCPGMVGATFEELRAAIETCNSQKFQEEMEKVKDTYEGYQRFRPFNADEGIDSDLRFSKAHLSVLRQAFRKLDQVTTEEEKDDVVKILTAFSKRVLKEPFAEDCKPFIIGKIFHAPTEVFFSFRKDPDLNQFVKDNANTLYVQAIQKSSPGVSHILKEKYEAELAPNNTVVSVATSLDTLGDPIYEDLSVSEHFLWSLPDENENWISEPKMTNNPEDLAALCKDFTCLYENFIKSLKEGTRSFQGGSIFGCIFPRLLSIPVSILLTFAKKGTIESEDFLRLNFPIPRVGKMGDGLETLLSYVGYPQEPRMYIETLEKTMDELKEKNFDLFKKILEEIFQKLKIKVDFLNNLILKKNLSIEENRENILKESEIFHKLFFESNTWFPEDCCVTKELKQKSEEMVKNYLRSRHKYPDFFQRNLDSLKKFYDNVCSDFLKRQGPEIEEKVGSKKVHRIEE